MRPYKLSVESFEYCVGLNSEFHSILWMRRVDNLCGDSSKLPRHIKGGNVTKREKRGEDESYRSICCILAPGSLHILRSSPKQPDFVDNCFMSFLHGFPLCLSCFFFVCFYHVLSINVYRKCF